eukprot:Skav201611  [mRNA]  locus=scaffold152:1039598:1039930:- [translate_table: standard]
MDHASLVPSQIANGAGHRQARDLLALGKDPMWYIAREQQHLTTIFFHAAAFLGIVGLVIHGAAHVLRFPSAARSQTRDDSFLHGPPKDTPRIARPSEQNLALLPVNHCHG